MRAIEIFGLRRVRDKPHALQLLQALAGLDAAGARAVLNQAIGGGRPQLGLADDGAARAAIAALAGTGFVARFAETPDFHAPAQAEAAIMAVIDRLPRAVSDGAGARLLVGDWQSALLLCLQAAAAGERPDAQLRQCLSAVALEVGVDRGRQGRG